MVLVISETVSTSEKLNGKNKKTKCFFCQFTDLLLEKIHNQNWNQKGFMTSKSD